MKSPLRSPRTAVTCLLFSAATLLTISAVAFWQRPPSLSATETACVGSWTYISPDHQSPTRVVYQFGADRSVCEQHYYLTSAYPTVPRITMRGRWRVDPDGRMVVEPSGGLAYARDFMSKTLGEYFYSSKEGWARPILTRFYQVKTATSSGLQVEASCSGGRIEFTMLPLDRVVPERVARIGL